LVAHAVHRMRQAFFILAQGTLGDLYKVTVAYSGAQVTGLHVAYFDTLPGCASALCILRAGFLFAACGGDGGGAHRLLQFADLGDESGGAAEGETFVPHDGLRSLAPVDELDCPAPVVRARMLNLAQELAPQMYALGGRTGAHPALRIVRRAADALELAASELPARALHVFRAHPWVAVSFARHTLVLRAASDGALQEASEHPLATDHQTLALCALPGAALLQATSAGLVLAPSAPGARRFEWAAAGGVSAAALAGATALVVDGGCARVLDVRPGEISERPDAIDAAECVALSPVDPGQRAPRFAAVGCSDGSVRVYLLGAPGSPISLAALQALSEAPASVAMARIAGQMLLFVGLPSGVLVRARVDEVSGELSSVRSRFLGPHAVLVRALDGVLVALAPQPWVCHAVRGCVTMTPLAYDALDDVAPLEVDGVERALVAVAQGSLRVLALDRLDSPEGSVAAIPLSLTPRIMHAHASGHFAVVEAEHRAQWAHNTAGDGDVEAEYAVSRTCEEASWAALVRVVNAFDGSTTHVEKLRDSWTVVSMTTVTFASTVPDQNQNQDDSDAPPLYLALGCARNMRLRPRSCEAAEIRLFRWSADGRRLLHVHTTPLDDIPQALVCLAGHLVVAQGPALRVYAMGRRQLLKRAHAIVAPHMVTLLEPATYTPTSTVDLSSSSSAAGLLPQRLLVADVQESVMLVEYSPATHAFCVLVADSVPRYLTVLSMLDEHTVAAGDKFGNLCVLRVPERAQRYIDSSAVSSTVAVRPTDPVLWDALCEYHVGDPLTMLQPCALAPAARSVLTYATLRGALMAAIPLPARRDIDLLVRLELAMRELLELPVRDHIKYRSSFMPVKAVVDGDLCEMFDCLELHVRENVAQSLDRSVDDISKKLHDLRSQYTFG
ncbi:pre-mRNA-splicing factor rse1, partial [Coemansia sp. RSA 2703]